MSRLLLSINDLTTAQLLALSEPGLSMMPQCAQLRGTLAILAQQPSIRTKSSFARAGAHMGLVTVDINAIGDAPRDLCDLHDELVQLQLTSSCVVVRSEHTLDRALLHSSPTPLISAGDGSNEHPTQALVDLAVMRSYGFEGKRVGLMGNLRDHRVQHSLVLTLQRLGASVTLICPPGLAPAPEYLRSPMPCLETVNANEVDDAMSSMDFVYLTPVVHWNTLDTSHRKSFTLDLARAQRVLKRGAKILHPFPRLGELAKNLDHSSFDAYHEQTRLGSEIRYRVLRWLLDDVLPTDTVQ